MPRTTTVESPGCPPLRALTFDALGLVKGKMEDNQKIICTSYEQKYQCTWVEILIRSSFFFFFLPFLNPSWLGFQTVIEARDGQNGSDAKIVDRWGDPDSSKCVLSASILDRESDPVFEVWSSFMLVLGFISK